MKNHEFSTTIPKPNINNFSNRINLITNFYGDGVSIVSLKINQLSMQIAIQKFIFLKFLQILVWCMTEHNNARPDKGSGTLNLFHECGVNLVNHSSYIPNLTPNQFILFPNAGKPNMAWAFWVQMWRLNSFVFYFMNFLNERFEMFSNGLKEWKCSEPKGKYFEKQYYFFYNHVHYIPRV